ncbi:MAG: toxin-antitoxin system YwqK family antitoxin [Flavobacteriaceae bacterium]
MLNIKRVFIVLLLLVIFLPTSFAQKINQLDVNGKRHGIWKKFYNNKRIRYEGKFNHGKEVGVFKFYDVTHSNFPTAIKEFSSGSKSAYVKFYTVKGKLRSEGKMIGRERSGKWKYYFPTGKIFSEEFYKNGKLDGEIKNYYSNGKLTSISNYIQGKKNGAFKKFSNEGVLIEQVLYKNDVLEGLAKYFDLKGNIKETGEYKAGKRFGKWEYYIDGEVVSEKEKKKALRENKGGE